MKNRRTFLQSIALAPLVGAGCANLQTSSSSSPAVITRAKRGAPKKIIHLVADGMSAGTLSCANHFSELTRGRQLTWFDIANRDGAQSGFMDMRSQNSIVTDSSAASSVWGSGSRIPNGKVNQDSKGNNLVTLYELLGDAGWKRALVTTTEITHATPAGFATATKSRDDADIIAAQYLDRKVDLLLGGGRKFFRAEDRKDKRDLLGDFRTSGYAVMQTPEDLRAAPLDKPWLGVFSSSHIPYVIDQVGGMTNPAPTPSLAQMTAAALRKLNAQDRFILQVEGGKVDHACHANDAAGAMHEMISFDEAVEVCVRYQKEHPETLLLLTTDHGNGNPALNGMGSNYKDSPKLFRNLTKIRQSIGEIEKALKAGKTIDAMRASLKEITGYDASERRMKALDPFLRDKGYALNDNFKNETGAIGQVLANYTGMSFTSGNHTSDLVPLLAFGPQADAFHGLISGPDIFFRYTEFAGVRFKNPQEENQYSAVVEQTEDIASYSA